MTGGWFDNGYIFIRQSWWLLGYFLSLHVNVDLGSEVDFLLSLLGVCRLRSTGNFGLGDGFWKMSMYSAPCMV